MVAKILSIQLLALLGAIFFCAAGALNATEKNALSLTNEPIIILKRNNCFNGCPDYTLSVYEDGRVSFEGRHQVSLIGRSEKHIDLKYIRVLKEEFSRIAFFSIDTTENTLDRMAPCTSATVVECAKLNADDRKKFGIIDACNKASLVTVSGTLLYCGFGDDLTYREQTRVKHIKAEMLKDKVLRKMLIELHDFIDQTADVSEWVHKK